MLGKVITVNLFKGGVGKTTLTQLLGYILSKNGYKVLLIDADPQFNLTKKVLRTYPDLDLRKSPTFMSGLEEGDLGKVVSKVSENLSIIQGSLGLADLDMFLAEKMYREKNDSAMYLYYKQLIDKAEFRYDFDFILIDTVPTISANTNNCLCSSDFLLIPVQTEQDCLDNLVQMLPYVNMIKENYHPKLEIIGIVPYLVDKKTTSKEILRDIYETYRELVFWQRINDSAVVSRWGKTGITEHRSYDKRTLIKYEEITRELLKRLSLPFYKPDEHTFIFE